MVLSEKIKETLLKVTIESIQNRKIEENLFSTNTGKILRNEIESINNISKYQWNYRLNQIDSPRDLLEDFFLKNFIFNMYNFVSQNIKKNFEKNPLFLNYYNKQYDILEAEILFSPTYDYTILIPTFNFIMDDNLLQLELDSNHIITNITREEDIYQNKYGIIDFKKIPRNWEKYWNNPPYASFEIKFSLPKRKNSEPPYVGFIPPAPFNSIRFINPVFEKVKSIFDFFYCFKRDLFSSSIFTFGDSYYVFLPPFSSSYFEDYLRSYTNGEFPDPYRIFVLKKPEDIKYWKNKWNAKYNKFYNNYFTATTGSEGFRMFKRVLDVLRVINKIEYIDLRNFLLISSFEGILYSEHIAADKLKYPKYNKKGPLSEIFIKLSEEIREFWQKIFVSKYPMNKPLSSFETKDDLKKFIISAFNYRNNIAHPEKVKKIKIQPSYLKPSNPLISEEERLEFLINQYFTYFLLFLMRIWINKEFKSITQWHDYLKSLFI